MKILGFIEGFIVAAIVGVMLITQVMCPGEADARSFTVDAPKKLVYAETADRRITSDLYLFALPNATAATTVQTRSCINPNVTIEPGRGVVLRDFIQQWTCSVLPEFGLVDAPEGVDAEVNVSFTSPQKFSFRVGPVGAISVGNGALAAVVSDSVDQAIVNVFPSQQETVYYSLNDGLEESCNVAPPVTQCLVKSQGVGTLKVYLKKTTCFTQPDSPLCADPAPLYGVVTNGRRDGVSSLKAYPF